MTDVIELPPLTDAMTARDIGLSAHALREMLGGRAEVFSGASLSGATIQVYPDGLLKSGTGDIFNAPTWPEAFTAARAWIETQATVHRDNRIRAMALAIIDLTDQRGRCDRAMLTRRDFSGAEVDDLRDVACQRASEMSANAPFSVEDAS